MTTLERATIDAAVWSTDIKTATRVVTAPIQQRRRTAARLREELTAAGQVKFRLDHQGRRRYLDATFHTADGRTLYVEIDGGIHLTLTTRWLDTAKDNDAVIADQKTLRFPSVAIYPDDPRALAQLRGALRICQAAAGL